MVRAGGGPETLGQHAAVSLIDWYDLTEEVLLVMERPLPAVDLHTYLEDNDGPLTERKAKVSTSGFGFIYTCQPQPLRNIQPI